MKKDQTGWIDPSAARRLVLEYQRVLRVRGASKIAVRIKEHTDYVIDRKTLENWLNDRGIEPSYITLKAIACFLETPHFATIVPRARDYLDADARLCRIGTALFDQYGAADAGLARLIDSNAKIAGWWVDRFNRLNDEPSYLHIVPVADHPFSKICTLVRHEDMPQGSGIVWPEGWGVRHISHFSGRIWSKDQHCREKNLKLSVFAPEPEAPAPIDFFFQPSLPYPMWFSKQFHRVDEQAVPVTVRDLFDEWSRSVLPGNLGNREDFFGFGREGESPFDR